MQSDHAACQRTQIHSGEPGASDAIRTLSVLSCLPEIMMGWTRQQNDFFSFAAHVPVLLGRSQKASAETSLQL